MQKCVLITIFTLINPFTCFFLHNLNNFVNIRTPVVERWLIQMKRLVAAPALLVLSRVLFTIESTTPLRSGWRGTWPT